MRASRSDRAGHHCGPSSPAGTCPPESSLPVRQGRAPLRLRALGGFGWWCVGLPVRQGRAPLRHLPDQRRRNDQLRPPGPTGPGTIAAMPSGLRSTGWSRRLPVRQGRAPLRHYGTTDGSSSSIDASRSDRAGHHCGARWPPAKPVAPTKPPGPTGPGTIAAAPVQSVFGRSGAPPGPTGPGTIAARSLGVHPDSLYHASRSDRAGHHCGSSRPSVRSAWWLCLPVRQGRAPLRRTGRQFGCAGGAASRFDRAGHHCGIHRNPRCSRRSRWPPGPTGPGTIAAHHPHLPPAAQPSPPGPTGPGTIAAATGGRSGRSTAWPPGPTGPGTIAARLQAVLSCTSTGLPVRQGRAPLRQYGYGQVVAQAVRASRSDRAGHHCGR